MANMKASLALRENAWNEQSKNLDREFDHLEAACNMPEAQKKILQIAIGILNKNRPIAKKYEVLSNKQTVSLNSRKGLQQLQHSVQRQIQMDRGKQVSYQVTGHGSGLSPNHQATAIAKAMDGDEKMARLVARLEDDEEIYDGMTALDRKLVQRDHDIKM